MEKKSRLLTGLVALYLGSLGIHNFYLGNTQKAMIQLFVSIGGYILGTIGSLVIVGAIFFAAPVAMGIWAFVEGIFILMGKEGYDVDAYGNPLRE